MANRSPDPPSELLDRHAELLGRLEDGELTPDDAAREVGADESELQRLIANWRRLDGFLARCGLDGTAPAPLDPRTTSFLERLRGRGTAARYSLREEVGRGGMARVLRAWDEDLQRDVAMKVVRADPESPSASGTSAALLGRFLEEAQITGQLDHPGIVSVHELGVDAEGEVFFTMSLVDGLTLDSILKGGEFGEWSRARVYGVLLNVCEAVAYAHSKGVVHRDLKPSNVMVGRFGETYVMDWGLAQVLDRGGDEARPNTHRRELAASDSGSAYETLPGQVVGTPAYMPPEQAARLGDAVGPQSDVYAVGAMLYEVLAGSPPHVERSGDTRREEVLRRVVAGPPPPVDRVAANVPAELAAICERAMARRPADRYSSMRALADDLRAFLEGRVVAAHRTGPFAEAWKWVTRNRATAAAAGAALTLALAGVVGMFVLEERGKARLQRLAELRVFAELESEAATLWPAVPALEARLIAWLARSDELAARIEDHRATLAALRARALPYGEAARLHDRKTHPLWNEIEGLRVQVEALEAGHDRLASDGDVGGDHSGTRAERLDRLLARLSALEPRLDERRTWLFADPESASQHDALAELLERWRVFADDDPRVGTVANVRARLDEARTVESRSVGAYRAAWDEARAAIAADERYGFELEPQIGLVPIGPDPHSGWWEFAHLPTGTIPQRGPDGTLRPMPANGVVLVLLPAARTTIGAVRERRDRTDGAFVDPDARASEAPLAEVALDAFFLSKYELTQAQWERMTGHNPSHRYPGFRPSLSGVTPTHPVERVSWSDCATWLPRFGLALPTEAQWEHAARAGTTTPRWTGGDAESLVGVENIDDRHFEVSIEERANVEHRDGFDGHAPVDAFHPNPWGFHHVLGNVSELCRDAFWVDGRWPRAPGDGLRRAPEEQGNRVFRGASFYQAPRNARSAFRETRKLEEVNAMIGVRPARALASVH